MSTNSVEECAAALEEFGRHPPLDRLTGTGKAAVRGTRQKARRASVAAAVDVQLLQSWYGLSKGMPNHNTSDGSATRQPNRVCWTPCRPKSTGNCRPRARTAETTQYAEAGYSAKVAANGKKASTYQGFMKNGAINAYFSRVLPIKANAYSKKIGICPISRSFCCPCKGL